MKLPVIAAQFKISLSVQKNLKTIFELLNHAKPGDLIVFPEGSVSGYSTDLSFLEQVDLPEVEKGLELLQEEAVKREIYLWVGTCVKEGGQWINAAIGFSPQNDRNIYRKINLANHERGTFLPGNELPVFSIKTRKGTVPTGIQICREIRYPEQWAWLARSGAQVILHLNNAVGDESILPVWRSHLISRAAETQRFVISVNNPAPDQKSPTMVIAPDGNVIHEVVSSETVFVRAELDLSLVTNWYLDQCRTDVIQIKSTND
jgi:predicted amidohydrolase